MDPVIVALIVVAAIVVIALIAWALIRQRRTSTLRREFGPEYDRTVADSDGRRRAEAELESRRQRREELDIQPLPPDAARRYAESWRLIQERFVDHPVQSVRDADQLVRQVMSDRGYPVEDFERRAADLSVDHPDVVASYRTAHRISTASDRGQASTEQLREAMIHYRTLFAELLEERGSEAR